jgi:hypothetical protein
MKCKVRNKHCEKDNIIMKKCIYLQMTCIVQSVWWGCFVLVLECTCTTIRLVLFDKWNACAKGPLLHRLCFKARSRRLRAFSSWKKVDKKIVRRMHFLNYMVYHWVCSIVVVSKQSPVLDGPMHTPYYHRIHCLIVQRLVNER